VSILTDMFDEKYDAWERAVGGCSFWYHARQKPETQAIMADGRMWLAVLLMKLQDQGEDPSPLLCALCDEVAFGRGNGFAEFCEKEVVPGMVAVDTVSWARMLLEWGKENGLPLTRTKEETC